ncbi:DUF6221 family protein [Streptomyces sp. NBC_01288]|uniref:DUF6221 family protein n=1 Tax=Streptomyces sp. NBC_01288 TaxID=2903814 RepID=UPI002E153B9F|nr:DUF6221 family protein [Streptomyces sp. NBC_01288]
MTNDLVEFLKARLDEEGDVARRCDGAGFSTEWIAHGAAVDFGQGDPTGFHTAVARHVALYDPARVLREVEAKRHVLDRHALSPAEGDPERPWDDREDCRFDGELWPCDDLLDLAFPYQEHPDFPERYKPRVQPPIRPPNAARTPPTAMPHKPRHASGNTPR